MSVKNNARMQELSEQLGSLLLQTQQARQALADETVAEYKRQSGIEIGDVISYGRNDERLLVASITARNSIGYDSVEIHARRRKKDGTFGNAIKIIYSADDVKKVDLE